MKRAIIVGVGGQDGQLLYELLTKNRYLVIGIDKNKIQSSFKVLFKQVNILNFIDVANLIKKFQPQEVYYLAAFHHSAEDLPIENAELLQRSYNVHVVGLVNFLEAIKKFSLKSRIFYAASSHIFGETKNDIQDEDTPINPNGLYGITKATGLALCRFYRSNYDIFVSVGILYNHESAFRTGNFVSMKIIQGAINIKKGKQKQLFLGDLDAVIDWGYALDYVRAMHLTLKSRKPDDFIIATGKRHTVLDFIKVVFKTLQLDWKLYIKEDGSIVRKQSFYRIGNSAKLRTSTGWGPEFSFKEMINRMIEMNLEKFSLNSKNKIKR
ncbi:MAG: GDP-mannose 4,6-dehydratase [Candidatus Omnitrophota bacterium]